MYYQLSDHFEVQSDGEQAWDFFSRAQNLPLITPPWLKFTIANISQMQIQADSTLDYTLRWMGVPIKWRTKIIDWSPPRQFIDLQIRRLYTLASPASLHAKRAGRHDLRGYCDLSPADAADWAGSAALVVKKQLLEIFKFRRQVIGQHLGWRQAFQDVTISRLR